MSGRATLDLVEFDQAAPPKRTDEDASPGPADGDGANDRPTRWNPWIARCIVAVVLAIVGLMIYRTRVPGHWWGDDWALYIRQAKGLLAFNPGEVAAQNEFTVTESAGAPFSPPIYPWGYPAVLALAIPIVGDGVDQLSIVGTIAALVFAWCWYRLARPRLGTVAAIVAMVAVCFAPHIMTWTDLIQSELVFMAAIGVFMVLLDTLVRNRTLIAPTTPLWLLVVVGLLAGFAFEVRREGLATIAALGMAGLCQLIDQRHRILGLTASDRWPIASRLFAPYVGFAAFVGFIKLAFPAVLVPRYPGSGVGNVWKYRHKHINHFADLIGIRDPHEPLNNGYREVFGSATVTQTVMIVWGALLALALIWSFVRWWRTEAHLAAYVIVAFVIGCSASAALARYFASVVPLCSLLVLTTIAAGARWALRRSVPSVPRRALIVGGVVALLVVPIAFFNIRVLADRGRNAAIVRGLDSYAWGAQHPEAVQMFEWVRLNTDPDDVVASFKARSMVLETGRNAVQVDDYRPMADDADVAVIVVERNVSPDPSRPSRYDRIIRDPNWVQVWESTPARATLSGPRLAIFAPVDSELAKR